MTKTFFSKSRAEEHEANVKRLGCDATIWTDRDGFGQTVYIVEWVFDTGMPANYWQPGCEDANNEPSENLWMADEELPFE